MRTHIQNSEFLLELRIPKRLTEPNYPTEPRSFGDHLRKKRMDLGLSQEDLARRLRVTEETITNWELGHSRPPVHLVAKSIRFLGYDPEPVAEPNGSLAQDVAAYRRREGLTQVRLAKRLRVDEGTVRSWERGSHRPSRHLLARFRRLTGN